MLNIIKAVLTCMGRGLTRFALVPHLKRNECDQEKRLVNALLVFLGWFWSTRPFDPQYL